MKINNSCALICATLLMAACSTKGPAEETVKDTIVETTILSQVEVARNLSYATTLEGYRTMSIAPSLTGRIDRIHTDVGRRVNEGDLLLEMDKQQYNSAKLTYSNLQLDFSRMEALVESGSISQQTYDQTKLSLEQTAENLRFLEENTYVKARFPGVIAAKNYEEGELYSGQPILSLTQINLLKAYINIPETYFTQIKQGMEIALKSDLYPDQTFKGSIETIYPTVDPASHTFRVKVKVPNSNEKLRPGMYVHASFSLSNAMALLIPYQSLQRLTGSNDRFVFVNDHGKAKRIFVKPGERYDDMIEIISDEISAGAEIITTGAEKVVDGNEIVVSKVHGR